MQETSTSDLLTITSEIAASFVSNNQVRSAELPELISTIHASLTKIVAPAIAEEAVAQTKPVVSIRKSITDDYLVCLDDGKKFKSLKRHLQTAYGMTPADYRAKWGLSKEYPMVAPGYAAQRSALAKAVGLGLNRKAAPAASQPEPARAPMKDAAMRAKKGDAIAVAPVEEALVKRRGRPKKAA